MGPNQAAEATCGMDTRIEFTMCAYDDNVFLVRNLVDQGATRWDIPRDIHDDARLILNEFATNVCRIYRGQVVKIWIAHPAENTLEMGIWDPDAFTPPAMKDPDEGDESGRGLRLVEAYSKEWGWYPSETIGGKVVWARLTW